jgi:hypothetical protein
MRFRVDRASGSNIGLSEIAAYGPNTTQFTLSTNAVVGGETISGRLTLAATAPQGGTLVSLSSGAREVVVPPTVLIAAGASSVTFAVTTTPVSTAVATTVTAEIGGSLYSSNIEVLPQAATVQNLALIATATSSTQSAQTEQLASKAIDGIVDGYPGDYTREWATTGEGAGAWVQLDWASPIAATSVRLFDRPNSYDNVRSGSLTFSDGTSVAVGQLPNDGQPLTIELASRLITWMRFTVNDSSAWGNIGLAEIEVLGTR